MIRVGSTITMEAWDMKYKPNSDWNHAWGAAPANIIPRFMWGIKPSLPGFKKVEIKPQLSRLSTCKIKIPTSRGTINAEYKLKGNNDKLYIIELPQGMQGDFVISQPTRAKIILNNKKVKANNGVIPLNTGVNRIEIK
jgi:hypothetical protein